MTWPQFAALDAFAGALHGKLGSFLWGPPLATAPRGLGYAAGTPVIGTVPSVVITNLSMLEWTLVPFQGALIVNVATFPTWAIGGNQATLGGITNHPEFNGETLTIITTGTDAHGPYIGFGPIANPTLFAPEADGGSVTFSQPANAIGSNLLYTSGWTPGVSGVLLPGDFFALRMLDANGIAHQRLFQYVGFLPLNTDLGGNAMLDMFPSTREVPVAGTPLWLTNAQGTFRLAENRRSAPAKRTKTLTFSMKCREAV